MALPHPRVLVAALSLVLLLGVLTGANANSPLEDPELDLLLDPSPVTATAVVAPEDTRLLQDVYENSVSGKTVTQAPQPSREAAEEVVTPTRGRGGKRRRNRKKKKQEERLAAEAEALTTTTTIAATLTAEVTTGMERLEVETASTTEGGAVKEEIVVDAPRIAYSRAWVNKSYRAREEFNPRGMEHLYLITNLFLSLVHREREVPRELGEYTMLLPTLLSVSATAAPVPVSLCHLPCMSPPPLSLSLPPPLVFKLLERYFCCY